ncbi:hypothetical protein D3C76_529870 [compost metagenome]
MTDEEHLRVGVIVNQFLDGQSEVQAVDFIERPTQLIEVQREVLQLKELVHHQDERLVHNVHLTVRSVLDVRDGVVRGVHVDRELVVQLTAFKVTGVQREVVTPYLSNDVVDRSDEGIDEDQDLFSDDAVFRGQ